MPECVLKRESVPLEKSFPITPDEYAWICEQDRKIQRWKPYETMMVVGGFLVLIVGCLVGIVIGSLRGYGTNTMNAGTLLVLLGIGAPVAVWFFAWHKAFRWYPMLGVMRDESHAASMVLKERIISLARDNQGMPQMLEENDRFTVGVKDGVVHVFVLDSSAGYVG
ncbi:MAG: hypothetical protein AAB421_05235 [Patescibacteria group bacterium]